MSGTCPVSALLVEGGRNTNEQCLTGKLRLVGASLKECVGHGGF